MKPDTDTQCIAYFKFAEFTVSVLILDFADLLTKWEMLSLLEIPDISDPELQGGCNYGLNDMT